MNSIYKGSVNNSYFFFRGGFVLEAIHPPTEDLILVMTLLGNRDCLNDFRGWSNMIHIIVTRPLPIQIHIIEFYKQFKKNSICVTSDSITRIIKYLDEDYIMLKRTPTISIKTDINTPDSDLLRSDWIEHKLSVVFI
jgi:hypothetical protein